MKSFKLITILLICTCFAGCSWFRPYVPPVRQGNILKPSEVNKIQKGMSKQQALSILGTPMLVDIFNANIWTYVHTKQIKGGPIMKQELRLYFENNQLVNMKKDLTPTAIKKQ